MASTSDPAHVPRIYTPSVSHPPVRFLTSCGDYIPKSGSHTPARSTSPVTPGLVSTIPASLLRTSLVESRSPSRGRSIQGEVPVRSVLSSACITRTTSPSDSRSITLSPSISPGGGSYHSSDMGYSPCSLSSSGYLNPPQFQADTDKKPYKARRQSSESLSMVRKQHRATTMPHGQAYKPSRQHRRRHKCRHSTRRSLKHNTDYCCRPGCQMIPTAPRSTKELCHGHVGKYRPIMSIRGNTDTYGRTLPRLPSDLEPPMVTRRWSSVEIGSHQILLASTLPMQSVGSAPSEHTQDDQVIPRRLRRLYRSSTLSPGVVDHDIARTVRARLTIRKVPSTHLRTPATITLRRASRKSGVSTVAEQSTSANVLDTVEITPPPYTRSQVDREIDTAYLITRTEIDSITELIEANLQRKYRPHNRINAHPPVTLPSDVGSPRITLEAVVPKTSSSSADSAVSIAQAKSSHSRAQDNLDYLQITSNPQTNSRELSRTSSQQSTHEIIWEAGTSSNNMEGSPDRMSSSDEKERKRSSASNSSSQLETTNVAPRQPKLKPLDSQPRDQSNAFDPNNARASISGWSWQLPPAEFPLAFSSSDFEYSDSLQPCEATHPTAKSRPPIRSVGSAPDIPKDHTKGKTRTFVRLAISASEIEDVVSFPPLPLRKTTNDWYSPLPDIDLPGPQPPSSRLLYGEGTSATGIVPVNLPATTAKRLPFVPLTESPRSPSSSVESDSDYQLRGKSFVKAHPHTPARVGSTSAMGSSIGASSGKRRKSSTRSGLQRVQTIDNIHKGKRAGTWTRNRPPSVCPPPKTPSPTEMEGDSDNSTPTIRTSQKGTQLSERSNPKSLKFEKGPSMPKPDRAGIYGKITGSVRAALGLDAESCQDECPPKHTCDDCETDPRNPSVDWIG